MCCQTAIHYSHPELVSGSQHQMLKQVQHDALQFHNPLF